MHPNLETGYKERQHRHTDDGFCLHRYWAKASSVTVLYHTGLGGDGTETQMHPVSPPNGRQMAKHGCRLSLGFTDSEKHDQERWGGEKKGQEAKPSAKRNRCSLRTGLESLKPDHTS